MSRSRRLTAGVVLCVLAAGLTGASLAWACTPTNWGWAAPEAPPAGQPSSSPAPSPQSAPSPQAESPSVSAPSGVTQPGNPQSDGPANSPSGSGNGPPSAPSKQPAGSPGAQPGQGSANAQSVGTESVGSRSGSQATASSAGSASARASGARGDGTPAASRSSAKARSSSPSAAKGGTSELWSAYGSGKGSSLTPGVSNAATPAAGPGSQLGLGMALLGLGAAGLLGGLAFAGARRRRATTQR